MSKNFEGKKPIYFNADSGVLGVFEGQVPDIHETKKTYIEYSPIGSIPWKLSVVRSKEPFATEYIHHIHIPQTGEESQPYEIVIVFEGKKEGVFGFMSNEVHKQLNEAKETIARLQRDLKSKEQVAKDAVGGYGQLQQKITEATTGRPVRSTTQEFNRPGRFPGMPGDLDNIY